MKVIHLNNLLLSCNKNNFKLEMVLEPRNLEEKSTYVLVAIKQINTGFYATYKYNIQKDIFEEPHEDNIINLNEIKKDLWERWKQ